MPNALIKMLGKWFCRYSYVAVLLAFVIISADVRLDKVEVYRLTISHGNEVCCGELELLG